MTYQPLSRITVTVPTEFVERLARIRYQYRISASAIIEHALQEYLSDDCEERLIAQLRARGASLRRI